MRLPFIAACLALVGTASAQTLDPLPRGTVLPQTSDMKMVGGDVAAFTRRFCGTFTGTCEVFVQPDSKGGLIGYLKLLTSKRGTSFDTATATRAGKQCVAGGNLENIEASDGGSLPDNDTTKDFRARVMVDYITGHNKDGPISA